MGTQPLLLSTTDPCELTHTHTHTHTYTLKVRDERPEKRPEDVCLETDHFESALIVIYVRIYIGCTIKVIKSRRDC